MWRGLGLYLHFVKYHFNPCINLLFISFPKPMNFQTPSLDLFLFVFQITT